MFEHISVRWRLLLAFFGISAFAVIAAATAMYSFAGVGQVLERITQQRVPTALASLELSRQAERVVTAAPALLAATTQAKHDDVSSSIATELEGLNNLLIGLKREEVDGLTLETIESAVKGLSINLNALDALVAARYQILIRLLQKIQILNR